MNFKVNHFFALLIVGSLAAMSCKTTKKAETTTATPKAPIAITNTASLVQRMNEDKLDFEWLAAENTLDYEGKPMGLSLNGETRMRRDSVIWFNFRKFGMGVARVLVNRDSVFAINYIQTAYFAEKLSALGTRYNLPTDFVSIQDLVLGNPVFPMPISNLNYEKTDTEYRLTGQFSAQNATWDATYTIDATTLKVKKMVFEQAASKKSVQVRYGDFDILVNPHNGKKQTFAYLRTIEVQSPETGFVAAAIEIDKNVEVNVPKTIRFEIPTHYKKM